MMKKIYVRPDVEIILARTDYMMAALSTGDDDDEFGPQGSNEAIDIDEEGDDLKTFNLWED